MANTTVRQAGVTNLEVLAAAASDDRDRQHVAVVSEVLRGFAAGDFDLLRSHLAPHARTWVSGFTPERLAKHVKSPTFVADTFGNGMHFELKAAACSPGVVFVEWVDEALTTGGARYDNNGVSVFHFDDEGRIAAYHEYIDHEAFFAVV